MNSLEYLYLQLRLEGKEVIEGNLLRQVEAIAGEEMPFMIVAQTADHQVVAYYDESLSAELCLKLNDLTHSFKFPDIHPIMGRLQSLSFKVDVGHYKTYVFPEGYKNLAIEEVKQFSKRDPKIQLFGFDGFAEEVYAVERNGEVVSACVSARENDLCGEAWVYTDEQYRHRGFAQKVVSAWASSLIAANKIPFYSHKLENIASANLARRLGVQAVFEEVVISAAI